MNFAECASRAVFKLGKGKNMSSKVMSCTDLIEKTKKHLRSVLISEKGGVALDRLERDYRELVSSFNC